MNAADWNRALMFWEHARRWLTRANLLLAAGAIIIVAAWFDAQRAANADRAIRILERQTAAAQQERHRQTLAAIAAKNELALSRARADSLEAAARAAKAESDSLARFVRIASETTLAVQITPNSSVGVKVPRLVTQYIWSLYRTIQKQDLALAARDTQTVRADTVIVIQDRVVGADSTVIDTQAATITEEKRARPRFGFRSGLAAGAAAVAILVKVLR